MNVKYYNVNGKCKTRLVLYNYLSLVTIKFHLKKVLALKKINIRLKKNFEEGK